MADKVGGDILSLQGSSGSVVDENGETIVSTDTGGGSSYILGPTLIRAIVGGVANGDFAKPPLGAETAISDENPLPYWTWVDSTSSGRITAALVANGSAASGNVLRFTAVGAQTGDKVYLERYVSVLGSQARTLTYQPRSVWSSATSNANLVVFTEAAFVKNDGSTVTGGSASGTANGTAIAGSTYAREVQANPNTNGAVPSDGAFIRLRFGISFSAAVAGTATAEACEVRIDTGSPQLILTDNAAPETYGYGVVYLNNGTLWIRANETGVSGTNPTISLSSSSGSIVIDPTGTGTAQVTGDLSSTGTITSAGLLTASASAAVTGNITATGTITATSHITGNRFYPGNQATRYIEDNGTYLRARNDFWAVGSLFQGASGIPVPVVRAGETASASTSIPANGSLVVTVSFAALPSIPTFAVLSIHWTGSDSNATVVVSAFTSTSVVTARLYNQTATAITAGRAINYIVGASN